MLCCWADDGWVDARGWVDRGWINGGGWIDGGWADWRWAE